MSHMIKLINRLLVGFDLVRVMLQYVISVISARQGSEWKKISSLYLLVSRPSS